jgi:ketosteroid isomerase-like protein
MRIELRGLFVAGDVATATGTLTLSGTGHDGRPFAQSSSSVVVYRRSVDGWRIALDAPWGLPGG